MMTFQSQDIWADLLEMQVYLRDYLCVLCFKEKENTRCHAHMVFAGSLTLV